MKYSPFSVFLRNLLVRKHFWFSCCASCGEIKTPLGKRLCASLTPEFPVDAVVAGALDPAARHAIRKANPWLRTVFTAADVPHAPQDRLPALAHTLPGIAECFLMAKDAAVLSSPLHVLDFFTPNGIPLIALSRLPEQRSRGAQEAAPETEAPEVPDVYAHTGENSRSFLDPFLELLESVTGAAAPRGTMGGEVSRSGTEKKGASRPGHHAVADISSDALLRACGAKRDKADERGGGRADASEEAPAVTRRPHARDAVKDPRALYAAALARWAYREGKGILAP
jgi:hypothetical protein